MAVFNTLVAFGAPIWNQTFSNADVGLQSGAGAIAVATFAGVLADARGKRTTSDAMRDAIAATFVVLYLVILGWSSFFNWIDRPGTLNPLTATFTTNFTALTGVVVAFYFGSKTVERITDARIADATKNPRTRSSGADDERENHT